MFEVLGDGALGASRNIPADGEVTGALSRSSTFRLPSIIEKKSLWLENYFVKPPSRRSTSIPFFSSSTNSHFSFA